MSVGWDQPVARSGLHIVSSVTAVGGNYQDPCRLLQLALFLLSFPVLLLFRFFGQFVSVGLTFLLKPKIFFTSSFSISKASSTKTDILTLWYK